MRSDWETSEIRVVVSNPGLVSAQYTVQLVGCRPPLHAPELHSSRMEPQGAGQFIFTLQNPGLVSDQGNASCVGALSSRIIIINNFMCFCPLHA